MEQIHFPLFFKSKELYYVLVKWRYVIPHIEGNEGETFPVQVGCHTVF